MYSGKISGAPAARPPSAESTALPGSSNPSTALVTTSTVADTATATNDVFEHSGMGARLRVYGYTDKDFKNDVYQFFVR